MHTEKHNNHYTQIDNIIMIQAIHDKMIITRDEPSASLASKQSVVIAEMIHKMRNLGKIIIIATHENCFDDICDQMVDLHYEKINQVIKKSDAIINEKNEEQTNIKQKHIKTDIKFVLQRTSLVDILRAKVRANTSLIKSGIINGITHQARTIARPMVSFVCA